MSVLVSTQRQLCVHCDRRVRRTSGGGGNRGLCYTCYHKTEIREQYPPDPKHGRRYQDTSAKEAPLPDGPTSAPPISEEKVRVMMERARLRQQLFHPLDADVEWTDDRED